MKVGLFISGHFQDNALSYENYRQFIEGHDLSVYVATWSTKNINRDNHRFDPTLVNVTPNLLDIFGTKLKNVWIGNMENFMSNLPPTEGYPPVP